jgi:Uma2 family endonuclease
VSCARRFVAEAARDRRGISKARRDRPIFTQSAAFVTADRLAGAGNVTGYFPGAPDLAVEVVSPNDTYAEVEDKTQAWLEAGARMVWIVNPRRRLVTVYRAATAARILTLTDELSGEDVIPGWAIRVGEIFGE